MGTRYDAIFHESFGRVVLTATLVLGIFACGKKSEFESKINPALSGTSAPGNTVSAENILSRKDVAADSKITASFQISPSADFSKATMGIRGISPLSSTIDSQGESQNLQSPLAVNKAKVSIAKTALEKEFLLQLAIITQSAVAMGHGGKSRIVAFRRIDNKIYLMEATQGHSVTSDLPQNLLLAEFPILEESENWITFDFNVGMSGIFVYDDWHGQDIEGSQYNPVTQFATAKTRVSFLESAELNQQNQMVIRQIAQILVTDSGTQINLPVEVKYYLSPYQPDASYEPIKSKSFDRMGFFEVAPFLSSTGANLVRATKFNHKKPIVFAISENTPGEYRQAVKDGILYWNRAFGSEVLKVIDAPKGIVAPDANHNVVQWVNWDQAGFAYADGQMDPRSGEILHAQVFMTSVFAFAGKNRARALLRNLETNKQLTQHKLRIGLNGFTQPRMCNFHMDESVADGISSLLASGADDAKILKAAQDYIREVVAHEIGHTLGLRHNFAGSLAANYPLLKRDEIVTAYFENGSTPAGVVTSSSVMEYQVFEESIMSGDQIAKDHKALEYDQKAIEALYLKKVFADSEIPLFCTDSHLLSGAFADCNLFDFGTSFVEYSGTQLERGLKKLPSVLLESYIAHKAPAHGEDPTPVEKVKLPSAASEALSSLQGRVKILKNFTKQGGILKIRRSYPIVNEVNEDEVRKAELSYIAGEVERLGGLEAILGVIPDLFAETASQNFENLLEKAKAGIGSGYGGQDYEFSSKEIETMRVATSVFFIKLKEALQTGDLSILAGANLAVKAQRPSGNPAAPPADTQANLLHEHELGDQLAMLFKKRIDQYVFATQGDFLVAEIEVPAITAEPTVTTAPAAPPVASQNAVKGGGTKLVTVRLPKFLYPIELRVLAASLLRDGRSLAMTWGLYERAQVQNDFKKMIEGSLTVPLSVVSPQKMPKSAAKWVFENRIVEAALGGAGISGPAMAAALVQVP